MKEGRTKTDVPHALSKIQNEMRNMESRLKWIGRNWRNYEDESLMNFFINDLRNSCDIVRLVAYNIREAIQNIQYKKEDVLETELNEILKLDKENYELFVMTPTEYWGDSVSDSCITPA